MEKLAIGGHAECVTMNGHWHQAPFDPAANGDIRVWALDKLRNRLGPMLCEAGVPALADRLDPEVCSAAIDALEPYVFGVLEK